MLGIVVGLVVIAVVFLLFNHKALMEKLRQTLYVWYLEKLFKVTAIEMKPRKEKVFACLREVAQRPLKVVEIAAGSGANFEFYPDNTEIICVEPNDSSKSYIMAKAVDFPRLKVEFRQGKAEDMSFVESGSIDAVVGTFALCSVDDDRKTLKEILRILKQGGKYVFMEHLGDASGNVPDDHTSNEPHSHHHSEEANKSHEHHDHKGHEHSSHQHSGASNHGHGHGHSHDHSGHNFFFIHLFHFVCGDRHRHHNQHLSIQQAGFADTQLEFYQLPLDRFKSFPTSLFFSFLRAFSHQCSGIATK